MTKPDLQVNFRMPAALKARLEHAAKENRRSLTSELIARLEESFTQAPSVEHAAVQSIIAKDFSQELAKQIAQAVIAEMDKNK